MGTSIGSVTFPPSDSTEVSPKNDTTAELTEKLKNLSTAEQDVEMVKQSKRERPEIDLVDPVELGRTSICVLRDQSHK